MRLASAPRTDEAIDALEKRFRPNLKADLLLWLIAGFLILFLIWAALAKIDRTVRGVGKVVTSSQLQSVSHLEGGIIEDILVKTGQQVAEGMVLIRLSTIPTNAEIEGSQAAVGGLKAKIARLEAEVTGAVPRFPSSSDPATQNQVRIERLLYQARQSEFAGLIDSGLARIAAARHTQDEANAILSARLAVQFSARKELSAIGPLVTNGIEPQLALISAEANLMRTKSEVGEARARVAKAAAGINEALALATQQQQDWRSRAGTELAASQIELSARLAALPVVADRKKRSELVSPVTGRINRVLVSTRGAAISPGNPLVEIVPTGEQLIIEIMVSPQDIASVRINQPALISITAYDSNIYGRLSGVVTTISPDAVANEKAGNSFYIVKIRAQSNTLLSPARKKLPIGPGMVADVSLLGDKRTVLSYLLDPLVTVKDNAFRE